MSLSERLTAAPRMQPRQILGIVFLSSILFRIALWFSGIVDVIYMTPDSFQYDELARSLATTGTFSEAGAPSMYRTPGFPLLVALVYKIFGYSQAAVTGAQILLDALTCVMVTDLALRLKLGRGAVGLTAILAVTCLFTSVYTFEMMTETIYIFALTLAVWLWLPRNSERLAETTPLRALGAGLALGYSILVRPAMMVPAFLFGLAAVALIVRQVGWRNLRPRTSVAPALLAVGVLLATGPWMIRNRLVFAAEYQKPNNLRVTPLGFKSPSPTADHFYMPQYNRYLASYEQPYVQLSFYVPPVVARYVYPGEKEEVEAAFRQLQADEKATGTFRMESLGAFERITAKRYEAAPRLRVTAPATLIAKLWISPRISVLWKDQSGHNSSRALILAMTAYSSLYLVGLLGLWWGMRSRSAILAAFVATMAVGHTFIYALWLPFPQARYAVVLYPLLSLTAGAFAHHVLSRGRSAAGTRTEPRVPHLEAPLPSG